jgi:hypothetical protein
MEKVFKVGTPDQIPDVSSEQFNISNSISDRFFALGRTIGGEVKTYTVIYDFREQKWKSSQVGLKDVIEYYIPI